MPASDPIPEPPPNRPTWRKGDVLVMVRIGSGGHVFFAEHDPTYNGVDPGWLYRYAPASDFRLATAADVARVLAYQREGVEGAVESMGKTMRCLEAVLSKEKSHARV